MSEGTRGRTDVFIITTLIISGVCSGKQVVAHISAQEPYCFTLEISACRLTIFTWWIINVVI